VSFGENRQQPVSRQINHSAFLLTLAQNSGKTPQFRRFRPRKPASYRQNPHFACHRYRARPRTKSKHSPAPHAPGGPHHSNHPRFKYQNRTPTVENGAMKPGSRSNLTGRMPHSAILGIALLASAVSDFRFLPAARRRLPAADRQHLLRDFRAFVVENRGPAARYGLSRLGFPDRPGVFGYLRDSPPRRHEDHEEARERRHEQADECRPPPTADATRAFSPSYSPHSRESLVSKVQPSGIA